MPKVEDWSVLCNNWTVGRVSQVAPGFHRAGDWTWAVQTYPSAQGYTTTLEEGLEHVREKVSFGPDGLPNLPAVSYLRMGRHPITR